MATSTKSPVTIVDDTTVGTQIWVTPSDAVSSNDAYAGVTVEDTQISHYLKATNFGFAIPTGATINGIQVSVERKMGVSIGGDVEDYQVRIVKGGVIGTTEKATAGLWPTTDTVKIYGSSSDLWGETWTVDDINASNFGFVISCYESEGKGNAEAAYVDHIQITVYYTEVSEWYINFK